jgi:hypothetical protein
METYPRRADQKGVDDGVEIITKLKHDKEFHPPSANNMPQKVLL